MLRRLVLSLIFLAGLAVPVSAQQDVDGASDHPKIPRYEGSWILGHGTQSFVSFDLPTGRPVQVDGRWQGETYETLEGASTRILYVAPKERSTLEIFRNYENALRERGFDILFTCSNRDCGTNQQFARMILWTADRQLRNRGDLTRYALTGGINNDHYLAARSAEGGTWLVTCH